MTTQIEHTNAAVVTVMDALNAGAVLLEMDGSITHANERACQTFGIPLNQLRGQSIRSLYQLHPDGLDYVVERIRNDGEYEGEFHLPLPDGKELPVVISGKTLSDPDKAGEHHLITFVDISKQKHAEQYARTQQEEITHLSDVLLEQALDLKHQATKLIERVKDRTSELRDANMEAVTMLAVASEAKDSDTGAHVLRIRQYTQALTLELGLDEDAAERFGYSSILHDVGKIQIPDDILKKPGKLDDDERRLMQTHTVAGHHILSRKKFFHTARQIARSHHEQWDGHGYPDHLSGESIPLAARIVSVADVYDALTCKRVYKPAWTPQDALDRITEDRGKHFDPQVVEAMCSLHNQGVLEDIAESMMPKSIPA